MFAFIAALITLWIWHPLYTTPEEMLAVVRRSAKAATRPIRQAYNKHLKKYFQKAADKSAAEPKLKKTHVSNVDHGLHERGEKTIITPKSQLSGSGMTKSSTARGGGAGEEKMGMMSSILAQVKGNLPPLSRRHAAVALLLPY